MAREPLVYHGRASHQLAKSVVELLGVPFGDLDIETFADDEPWFRLNDYSQVGGNNVFIIQSTPQYAPSSYFDLWGIMDAVHRQSPKRLVVVMPFFGFRRQERDKDGGEAVMADLMARFIAAAGATHIILCDPHAPIIVEYFKNYGVKVIVIDPNELFISALGDMDRNNLVALTPDRGREDTARRFAEGARISLIGLRKDRPEHDHAEINGISEEARAGIVGKITITREDEVSTATTIIATGNEVHKAGALDNIVMATHAVLAGGAVQKLKKNKNISRVYVTNSIYLPWVKRIDKIKVLSLAPLIASCIKELNED